jgi:hypothetical protein
MKYAMSQFIHLPGKQSPKHYFMSDHQNGRMQSTHVIFFTSPARAAFALLEL